MAHSVVGRVLRRISEPKICTEVDDDSAGREPVGHLPHRPTVGGYDERHLGRAKLIVRREHEVRRFSKIRMRARYRLSGEGVQRDLDDLGLRMTE